jgi:hypothetical protein
MDRDLFHRFMVVVIAAVEITTELYRIQNTELSLLVNLLNAFNSTPPVIMTCEDQVWDMDDASSDSEDDGERPVKRRRFWEEYPPDRAPGLYETLVLGVWPEHAARQLLLLGGTADVDYLNQKYVKFFRVHFPGFLHLYGILRCVLEKADTHMRQSIPGEKKLFIFLYWLAHGSTNSSLAHTWSISTATVHYMKIDVVNKLSTPGGFVRQMVRFPRGAELTAVMEGFADLASLPGCCGAMDGTFVQMPCPSGEDSCSMLNHATGLFGKADSTRS